MKLLFASLFFFSSLQSFAASCCGGGGGASTLIAGDLKAVIRMQVSEKTYLADVFESNLSNRNQNEVDGMRTYTLSSSYRFKDFYQVGFSMPIQERLRNLGGDWTSKTSLGDVSLNFGYEFFSEYTYNPFLSQAILYTGLTLPTGKSIYTTNRPDEMDVTGTGHEVFEVGALFVKNFMGKRIDLQTSLKFRPAKSFDNAQTRSSVGQYYNLTFTYDLFDRLAIFTSIASQYESMKLTAIKGLEKRSELLMPMSFGALYSLDNEYDISLTYTDDFIFGGRNSALGKTIGLNFVRKFLL